MKIKNNILVSLPIILTVLFLNPTAKSQTLDIDSSFRIILRGSNEMYPSWSDNGKKLVFQSVKNGYSNILLYDIEFDTIREITTGLGNNRHPVFISNSQNIAFDSQINNKVFIDKIDPVSGKQQLIFTRSISCKEPSFSPSGRLMIFTGYDRNSESWQIFSYDFVYDNLNQLTRFKNKYVFYPQISPNGKTIVFGTQDKFAPYSLSLKEINWYGNKIISIDTLPAESYCWSPDSFRIICMLKKDNNNSTLISIRRDGTSAYCLLGDSLQKATPALSPDGKKLAVAIKFKNDFDIVIININEE